MDFQYYGANCIRISTKRASIVIDDNLASLGAKQVTKADEIALITTGLFTAPQARLVFDQPGEYEASDISFKGIAARAHMDEPGKTSATMFRIIADDIRVAILGHVHPDLSNDQLEALGMIDVLFIPVGGNGYTLDPTGALKVIKAIEPKIVIPTHYDEAGINFEVPQQTLDEALKVLSMEPRERVAKLKVKGGELSESTQLVILERQ